MASGDKRRVSAGPGRPATNTGRVARVQVTKFAVILLTESTVGALNLLSCSASTSVSAHRPAPRGLREGMVARSKTGCWSANLPTRR